MQSGTWPTSRINTRQSRSRGDWNLPKTIQQPKCDPVVTNEKTDKQFCEMKSITPRTKWFWFSITDSPPFWLWLVVYSVVSSTWVVCVIRRASDSNVFVYVCLCVWMFVCVQTWLRLFVNACVCTNTTIQSMPVHFSFPFISRLQSHSISVWGSYRKVLP